MSGSYTQGNPNLQLQGTAGVLGRPGLTALIWTCFGSATCMVATRLAVRWRQNRRLLVDDYWIVLALLSLLTLCVLQTVQNPVLWKGVEWLAGRLVPQSAEELVYTQTQLVLWTLPIVTVFWTALWSVKASFLALFYQLVRPNVVLRRCWYAIAVFVGLSYVGVCVSTPFVCDPPTNYFRGDCTSKGEIKTQVFLVGFTTAMDIFTDLLIMALPIALLPSLQLSLKKKIGLGVCFCLALLTISFAVVRMTQVTNGTNNTIELIGYAAWTVIECTVAVIVGTLPPLKSLLSRRGMKRSGGKKRSSRDEQNPSRTMLDSNEVRPQNKRTTTSEISRSVASGDTVHVEISHVENEGIYVQKTFDTRIGQARPSSSVEGGEKEEQAAVMREVRC